MKWNKWFRQIHRWLSIAFTLAVIINVIAWAQQKQAVWIGLLALFPLAVLLLTGLYLFALPYLSKTQTSTQTFGEGDGAARSQA
jgi:hypothetical protein